MNVGAVNSGSVQQSRGVSPPSTGGGVRGAGQTAAGGSDSPDTVSLSAPGKFLSELPALMLPTRENVQKLSAALSEELKKLFSEAGINPDPPIEFDVDSHTGKVSVKSDRPDAQNIAELIRSRPDVEMQIHNVAAISSHVVAMGPAMEADAAYRAAQNQAETDKVIARYASVYGGRTTVTDFSLVFDGTGVQVYANGAVWMSAASSNAS